MIQRIKWFDRGFDFSSPPEMFPFIMERLRGTAPRIREITANLSNEQLSLKIDGNWSIKEHIGHITDLESLHNIRLTQLLKGEKELIAADYSNRKTNLANHNLSHIEFLIDELESGRNKIVAKFEEISDTDIVRSALHPRLNKQMRIIDLAFFMAEHDDHHITIMREIAKAQSRD